ncbi:hypothetical protein [Azonexus sp. R2A61]|uniref:hypothetical protein n=1 Tax=Azonexus sp. R2A61 TaxID=2744443 RepID=UPI001F45A55F|nr:hypothetical protein [Azonexus sp. R2A61]
MEDAFVDHREVKATGVDDIGCQNPCIPMKDDVGRCRFFFSAQVAGLVEEPADDDFLAERIAADNLRVHCNARAVRLPMAFSNHVIEHGGA